MSSRFPFHFKTFPKAADRYKQGERKVYFPSFPMRMIRPSPNQPRDVAVFHVPPRVNKIHVYDYLKHVYGVKVNYIRTAIYEPKRLKDHELDFELLRLRTRYLSDFAEHYAGREDIWTTRYEGWLHKSDVRLNATFRKSLRIPAYKKVIVNLAEPFMFPPKPDPMAFPQARKAIEKKRQEWDSRNPTLAKLRMENEEAAKTAAPSLTAFGG